MCFNTVGKITVFRKKLALKLFNMNKNYPNSSKGFIKKNPNQTHFFSIIISWTRHAVRFICFL